MNKSFHDIYYKIEFNLYTTFFTTSNQQQNIRYNGITTTTSRIKNENKDCSITSARIQSVQICNTFNYFKYFITHCRVFHNVQYITPLCI